MFVKETYDKIATHFDETRKAIWKSVGAFLDDIPSHSFVVDVGCGNGKYMRYRSDIFVVGTDICLPLLHTHEKRQNNDVCNVDGLSVACRPGVFDYAISIAVVHHLKSHAERKRFLSNIIRMLCPGGKMLFTVWAAEQDKKKKWLDQGGNDFLIPWLDRHTGETFYRYYHLFSECEVKMLVAELIAEHEVRMDELVYEKDNWVVILTCK
jgi:tRNA (uracil-5-)-methyltransferase TRM9